MQLVVDANVVISALIADSKTRELIVTLDPDLLTPDVIHDEIERHEQLIVQKSGLSAAKVRQFLDLLFDYIEIVPTRTFHTDIGRAEEAIGETDPDDVLYLACALSHEAAIWSDDSDYAAQELVPVYSTPEIIESFDPS